MVGWSSFSLKSFQNSKKYDCINVLERGEVTSTTSLEQDMTGPIAVDTIGTRNNLDKCWYDYDCARRDRSPWASIV